MSSPSSPRPHPSLHQPLRLPPPVTRPNVIDRKASCWCGSGLKFKHCHLDRERRRPFNPFEYSEAVRKELGRRYCSHADESGATCGGPIIDAHTVQKEGGLRAIARGGKVYTLLATLNGLIKTDGRLEPRLIGIGDASVFSGFCSNHDNDLFRPIEGKTCTIGPREALLFAYRAACFAAFMKRAQCETAKLFTRLDEGRPVEEQESIQNAARAYTHNAAAALDGTHSRKASYDRRVKADDTEGFHYSWTRFDTLLPVASCGTFLPDFDLAGTPLQRIGHGDAAYDQVALNVTAYEGRSVIVLGWTGAAGGPASRFAASFHALDDGAKAACAVRLPLEYLENSYINPEWWEALSEAEQRNLVRHSSETFGRRRGRDMLLLSRPLPNYETATAIEQGGSGMDVQGGAD